MCLLRLLLLLQLVFTAAPYTTRAFNIPRPSCRDKCGDIEIPYPFGIGEGCYAAEYGNFHITCDETSKPPKPMIIADPPLEITKIDLVQGGLTVKGYIGHQCFFQNGSTSTRHLSYDISSLPYTFSSPNNTFKVVGCNTRATVHLEEVATGCFTYCTGSKAVRESGCSGLGSGLGLGCCTSEIPNGLKSLKANISRFVNDANFQGSDRCGFAFLVSRHIDDFRLSHVDDRKLDDVDALIELDWAIGNQTCEQAKKNPATGYGCRSNNSECHDRDDGGVGYLCRCSSHRGNPYLESGCEAVGNASNGLKFIPWGSIVGSLLIILSLTGSACSCWVFQWRKVVKQRKKFAELKRRMFEQNGGLVLQEHISSQPGNTFKIFNEADLVKATDGFRDDRIIGRGGHGVVYMGRLESGVLVAIKKSRIMDERESKEFAREMAILSQINHVNVVKILGCCLEVEVPMLVYEFVSGGTLFRLIHHRSGGEPISLATRLRIATEVSEALAYLHSYASPPIFHKDVKTSNVLLDRNGRAKVSDFGASAVAPAGEAEVATAVQGTCGYLDPEYLQTYQFTEKSDVYSFGVVLVELLTGRKPFHALGGGDQRGLAVAFVSYFRHNRLMQILDADVFQVDQMKRLVDIAGLACRCLSVRGVDRPTMKEVTIALHAMGGLPWENPALPPYAPEGTDSLLGEGQSTAYGNMDSGIPDDSAVLGIRTGR